VVEAASKALVLAWFPTIYFGNVAVPFVHCARAQTVDIESDGEPLAFEGDGEIVLPTPGNVTLIPGAIAFSGAPRC